jgi:LPS-assembly protein
MKNKNFFLVFFIFSFLIFLNNSFSEEFYFETPEIQTFESGNLLKAPKGGKALTDNNIEILADKFEYNKMAARLIAKKNVVIIDSLNKVVIKANKVIYLKSKEKFLTEGKTEITVEDKYVINSTDVVFLRNEKQIYSDKHTNLIDDENNFYTAEKFRYLIKKRLFRGNQINLITKNKDKYFFEDALINLETKELQGKDIEVNFNNNMFNNEQNEPRLKGNKALSNENETIVSKGSFTTCKKRPNNKCPPWIIEAKEARHDKIRKIIFYKNAWLKIYDVPVLYYPFFFHPDPTVKRQSGFLTPQIGESQVLGSSAYIPYFYVISDSKDLTFKPRIFSNNKYSIQTEYRQVTKKTNSIVDFSLTQGHKSSDNDNADSRSHFFSNSTIDLNFLSFDETNLEIQLQKTSNNTYLKVFNFESPLFGSSDRRYENYTSSNVSTLNSFMNLTANSDDLNFNTSVQVYENLDAGNSDRYQFVFPNYYLNKNIETNDTLSGSLSFISSGSQHLHSTNVKETQIINDLLYQSQDKFLTNGIINNYKILLKNSNSKGSNSTKFKNKTQSEMLSSFIFESSYPLLREGLNFNNYLTPKLSLRYSPNSMKNLKNEDRRIDINNIFSFNRIGHGGTVESGQSLTIGGEYLKSRKINDNEDNPYPTDLLKLSLATVFRDEINENMPNTSSLGRKSSDVVGNIRFSPNNFFSSNYNFSLDNNLDVLKYNSLDAKFTVNNFITSFKYLEENDSIGDSHYIVNKTSYKFNGNNSINFSIRENKKINLTEFYDLIYQYRNDCLTAAIKYRKDFYIDDDLQPTEQLFFSLTIVPLGAYESTNIISKYGKYITE